MANLYNEIDEIVTTFCSNQGWGIPTKVSLKITDDAIARECVHNVDRHIIEHGGSCVLGRKILYLPNSCVTGIAHGIWKSPDGILIDITPDSFCRIGNFEDIIFSTDDSFNLKDGPVSNVDLILSDEGKTAFEFDDKLQIVFDRWVGIPIEKNRFISEIKRVVKTLGKTERESNKITEFIVNEKISKWMKMAQQNRN